MRRFSAHASPHQSKEGSKGQEYLMLGRPGSSSHALAGIEEAKFSRIGQYQQGLFKDGIQEMQVGPGDGQSAANEAALSDQARVPGETRLDILADDIEVFGLVPDTKDEQHDEPGVFPEPIEQEEAEEQYPGIPDEMHPLGIQLADDTIRLLGRYAQDMNLDHLSGMFDQVSCLPHQQQEQESQPRPIEPINDRHDVAHKRTPRQEDQYTNLPELQT